MKKIIKLGSHRVHYFKHMFYESDSIGLKTTKADKQPHLMYLRLSCQMCSVLRRVVRGHQRSTHNFSWNHNVQNQDL